MFHVKHTTLGLLLLICSSVFGQGSIAMQDKPFAYSRQKDRSIDSFLQRQPHYHTLDSNQKEMFYWVNLFRKDPRRFKEVQLAAFLRQYPETRNSSANSLIRDLSVQKPLPLLSPDSLLNSLAVFHCLDMASNIGGLSHASSKGKSFETRMTEAGIQRCAAENLLYGGRDVLKGLILLLIDHGVPGYGHRKTLLDATYTKMGVGILTPTDHTGTYMTQLFSCD